VWSFDATPIREPSREQRTMLQRPDATRYDGRFRDGSLHQELTLPRAYGAYARSVDTSLAALLSTHHRCGQRLNPHRNRCVLWRGCEPEAPHLTCQEHAAHQCHDHAAVEECKSCNWA
jgi:hypothetical protein